MDCLQVCPAVNEFDQVTCLLSVPYMGRPISSFNSR